MKAKKMSLNAERKLLKAIQIKEDYLGNGSSRLVFLHPFDKTKVVKVAFGADSLRQNKLEVEMWNKHGETGFLAQLFEYGRYCIVMERVEEVFEDDCGPGDEKLCEQFHKIADWMTDVFDCFSPDYYQIGRIGDKMKAYDYGFNGNVSSGLQVGWADAVTDYNYGIRILCQLLKEKKPANYIERYANKLCYE